MKLYDLCLTCQRWRYGKHYRRAFRCYRCLAELLTAEKENGAKP